MGRASVDFADWEEIQRTQPPYALFTGYVTSVGSGGVWPFFPDLDWVALVEDSSSSAIAALLEDV